MEMLQTIRGLVRPTISILFALAAVYLAVVGKIAPGEFLPIVATIIAFHFGERKGQKDPQSTEEPDNQPSTEEPDNQPSTEEPNDQPR